MSNIERVYQNFFCLYDRITVSKCLLGNVRQLLDGKLITVLCCWLLWFIVTYDVIGHLWQKGQYWSSAAIVGLWVVSRLKASVQAISVLVKEHTVHSTTRAAVTVSSASQTCWLHPMWTYEVHGGTGKSYSSPRIGNQQTSVLERTSSHVPDTEVSCWRSVTSDDWLVRKLPFRICHSNRRTGVASLLRVL